jgi:hypothetical protein
MRHGLELGRSPVPAPVVVMEVGGVGMVVSHRGSDDETDRYVGTECRNVEYWFDTLDV